MKDAPLTELLEAITHDCCPIELVREALRALWAVRVLDAWRKVDRCRSVREFLDQSEHVHLFEGTAYVRGSYGPAPDAARLAAAEAVFPELPADVRAKLGDRP